MEKYYKDAEDPFDFYTNNFIITGIPRSGTSLMSSLLNTVDNMIVFNEVICKEVNFYDVPTLPGTFSKIRKLLWNHQPVPNRYDRDGKLTTNTMKDGENLEWKKAEKPIRRDVRIGSKINAPYLGHIGTIIENGFKVIAIIRHPVYVIGSYQMPHTATLNIANPLTDPRYAGFGFQNEYAQLYRDAKSRSDVVCDEDMLLANIHCQAELWNHFAGLFATLSERKNFGLIKYEAMVDNPKKITEYIMQFLGFDETPKTRDKIKIKNRNDVKNYLNISFIREAVKMWCSNATLFGYDV